MTTLPHVSAPRIIRGLDDVTPVPTPVTMITSQGYGQPKIRHTEERLQAKLFTSADGRGRPMTLVASNVYGDPFRRCVALQSATIAPYAQYPWYLHLVFREGRQRRSRILGYRFPGDCLLLAWGTHVVSLDDLPLSDTLVRWHSATFAPLWRTVAQRFHALAGSQVWLDTTEAGITALAARNEEMARREAAISHRRLTDGD